MTKYLNKEKIIKAFGTTHTISIYNSIIRGEFDIEISPPEGYMLASIEDYNNKSKLLKEKDVEINRLKNKSSDMFYCEDV